MHYLQSRLNFFLKGTNCGGGGEGGIELKRKKKKKAQGHGQ